MILTIDIGNINVVVGCSKDDKFIFVERFSTQTSRTPLEYAILIKNIFEIHGIEKSMIHGGIIASVVPSVTSIVKEAAEKIISNRMMVVGPGIKTGLSIIIDNPAQLGADLVAGAVAGIDYYGAPLIIFDFSAATAVSVIDQNRNYIGGMILTGVTTALEALIEKTSLLQRIAVEPPRKIIGSNTTECMKSGAVYGTAASVDGLIDRLEEEIGCGANVVATGLLADKIIPYCRRKIILDNELLLKGLVLIYNKNKTI